MAASGQQIATAALAGLAATFLWLSLSARSELGARAGAWQLKEAELERAIDSLDGELRTAREELAGMRARLESLSGDDCGNAARSGS
jgi:hypothetical protein